MNYNMNIIWINAIHWVFNTISILICDTIYKYLKIPLITMAIYNVFINLELRIEYWSKYKINYFYI